MAGAAVGIGMMDPAYFVGRKAILQWINETFDMSVTRIEDTASGAIACQVMDYLFPGEVPMSKVRWDAKTPAEFTLNYKVLQDVFNRKKIPKHVEVERLVRAKPLDNIEFLQWLKSFFDANTSGDVKYNAVERRALGKGATANPIFLPGRAPAGSGSSGGGSSRSTSGPTRRPAPSATGGGGGGGSGSGDTDGDDEVAPARSGSATRGPPASAARPPRVAGASGAGASGSGGGSSGSGRAGAGSAAVAGAGSAARKVEELTTQLAEMRMSVEALEKERDWYFSKLRDIEILLQAYDGPDKDTVKQIFKVLYATEDDFVAAEESAGEAPASGGRGGRGSGASDDENVEPDLEGTHA